MDASDIRTKRCLMCGWEYPPDTMQRGVCEDCQEQLDNEEEELERHKARRRRFDDEQ